MTTTTVSVQDKVRNYQGQNRFVVSMKEVLQKWGRLTPKQAEAAEKALNSEVKVIKTEEMPEGIKRIVDYKGENNFVKDIASKFQKYGTLTEKQISAALKQIQKEEDKEKTIRMNWPTIGETIKLGRKIGEQLKETYGLKFTPILIDITSLKAVSSIVSPPSALPLGRSHLFLRKIQSIRPALSTTTPPAAVTCSKLSCKKFSVSESLMGIR